MSVQRRSSSPLSSASPSPVQAPTANGEQTLTSLHLGPPADVSHEDGELIGGSSPTTLTEPLTDSELTEDDDDDEEADAELLDDADADEVPQGGEDDSELQHGEAPRMKRER